MKTLIIYNPLDSELEYVIVDGDYGRFHGIVVNSTINHPHEEEFIKFFFEDETGKFKHQLSSDKSLIEGKDWDKVAIVTWIP